MPYPRPQRPNGSHDRNGDARDRDRVHRGDSFRPSPPRFPPPRERFSHESDSWRPGDDRRQEPRPRSYHDDHRGPGDSYRPRVPQGEFTFRVEQPPSIRFTPVNLQPSDRRPPRRDGRGGPARKPTRPRWQPPPHPSERALISGITSQLPEERLHDSESAKFRDLAELSDDEELAMEISSQSSQSDSEGRSTKRARTAAVDESANSAPKWSNPDPYTALPCPDETTRKKRDVVKLIRRARLEDTSNQPAASTKAEDFLSFDLSENEGEGEDEDEDEDKDEQLPSPPPPPNEIQPPLPPGPPPTSPPTTDHRKPGNNRASALPSQPVPVQDRSGPLGSRKRTADDEIKFPEYGQLKKVSMKPVEGDLVRDWCSKPGEDSCPWATVDHSTTADMGYRLHKEIMDFYEYAKPRKFEQAIRDRLVDNLRKAMKRDGRNFASAQLFPFGSFMSGLYLPTADMDMVVCSASFMRGGPPTYLGAKSWLYKFQKFLVAQRIADASSIEVIAHARIPLVKFVDKLTGLKVDVSFENLGGVEAIDTFLRWKEEYPAMPILVTIIKHFLLMRGLNEPVNGGIGGYSVICLVVSMLQLMPKVQADAFAVEQNLGEMLVEFLELYAFRFNFEVNAISLCNPVGYIHKRDVATFTYKNMNRLSIIDPNNPGNDISGGSSNTWSIVSRFGDAYFALRNRMEQLSKKPKSGNILEVILEGNYSSFRTQRAYLQHLHERVIGTCSD